MLISSNLAKLNLAVFGAIDFNGNGHRLADPSSSRKYIVATVTVADDWLQPDLQLILRILNDDCLREVFLHLDLVALTNVAEVCVRFRDVANEAFIQNFKCLSLTKEGKAHSYTYNEMELFTERVMKNFGLLIVQWAKFDTKQKCWIKSVAIASMIRMKLV